jgi:quinol monooxygenase YgiN
MQFTRALLVHLEAKHGREAAMEEFLRSASALVAQSPATSAWFALRFGRGEYGIFDAFRDDAGRNACLSSPIAAALMAKADELLAQVPRIRKLDVLASKRPTGGVPVHDAKGLLLTFEAKPGQERQVEQFLCEAQPYVLGEHKTTAWFALRLDNGEYGVFDVFPDGGARFLHITGQVPRALAKHALSLLGKFPELTMLDVIAENFNTPQ